jgi:hypothetical protein
MELENIYKTLALFLVYLYILFTWYYANYDTKKIGRQALIVNCLILGPVILLHHYYLYRAPYPIINISDNDYVNTLLTLLTYVLNRIAVIWGSMGVIFILLRYFMFWFGLGGGVWSPFVQISAMFYQPWVSQFPYVVGGVMDLGPILGMWIHKRVSVYFRNLLWCPLPPGILTYDKIENKFLINYQLLENFYSVLFRIIPKSLSKTTSFIYVYLPFPKNCEIFKNGYGYLFPVRNNFFVDGIKSYDILSQISRFDTLTSEYLQKYFIDLHP